jgi:NAD(P)-dependent dehydrogenase (short-subunit alcohol dehydrogenase family)
MIEEFSLEGKRVLITGGSTGLGLAMGLVFAEAGADVALTARRIENLRSAEEKISVHGHKVVSIATDVSDSSAVDAMVVEATEAMGGIDVLVNNAGRGDGGPVAALAEQPGPETGVGYVNPAENTPSLSDDIWQKTIETNLSGPFYTCRAVASQMMERRYGKVINIASTNAVMAYPYGAPYQTSKAGLKMFTKVLAMEWAQFNINVNCIMPGWFITEMTRRGFENQQWREKIEAGLPLKRLTKNRDLGLLALYLASPASDWMTGQAIALDGGETALHN